MCDIKKYTPSTAVPAGRAQGTSWVSVGPTCALTLRAGQSLRSLRLLRPPRGRGAGSEVVRKAGRPPSRRRAAAVAPTPACNPAKEGHAARAWPSQSPRHAARTAAVRRHPPRQSDRRASLTVSTPQGSCSPQRAPQRTKAPLSPRHQRGGRAGALPGADTLPHQRGRAGGGGPAPPTTAGRAACEALEEELRSESACCSEDPGPFHAVRQGRETESPAGCHTPPSTADRTKSGPVGHERPFLVRPGRAGHHHMDRWAGSEKALLGRKRSNLQCACMPGTKIIDQDHF
ncbi:uncharacterized protein [Globicephala melas]|uniref:uncharacterized protein n=1 Tax=Globicephala melas TaxID=9731 RepID=UPI003872D773